MESQTKNINSSHYALYRLELRTFSDSALRREIAEAFDNYKQNSQHQSTSGEEPVPAWCWRLDCCVEEYLDRQGGS